jgi:hypothetical protein
MNKDIKIFDNFLEEDVFLQIKNVLFSEYFPWFYNDYNSILPIEMDNHFQFIHNFYLKKNGGTIGSNLFEEILPIVEKINPISLIRVKANLTTRTFKNETYGFHTDVLPKKFIKTGIFYLNSSNGGTAFKNNNIVECVENRFVCFPSNLSHSGVSATDVNARIVINFNYI